MMLRRLLLWRWRLHNRIQMNLPCGRIVHWQFSRGLDWCGRNGPVLGTKDEWSIHLDVNVVGFGRRKWGSFRAIR